MIDPYDAPDGFMATIPVRGCRGCVFYVNSVCTTSHDCGSWKPDGSPRSRRDRESVIFKAVPDSKKAMWSALKPIREEVVDPKFATQELRAVEHMLCRRLGGTVEGSPTSPLNYLQRVDELRAIELECTALRAAADTGIILKDGTSICFDVARDGNPSLSVCHFVGTGADRHVEVWNIDPDLALEWLKAGLRAAELK